MALIDDIEFYGRAVDAGDISREAAVAALIKASGGDFTQFGAEVAIAEWVGTRAQLEQNRDVLRATMRQHGCE